MLCTTATMAIRTRVALIMSWVMANLANSWARVISIDVKIGSIFENHWPIGTETTRQLFTDNGGAEPLPGNRVESDADQFDVCVAIFIHIIIVRIMAFAAGDITRPI